MVNFFIYATDDSGSTCDQEYFHSRGLVTLDKFKKEVAALKKNTEGSDRTDRIVYLHWSHRCEEVHEDEVRRRYEQLGGNGSATLPHTVLSWTAEHIRENDTIELLYVITDGAVRRHDIRPCDPNMKIDYVSFYAFNSCRRNIDMSVASMFVCNNKRYKVHCNDKLVDETDLSNPFDYDQITVETFDEMKEQLKSYIKIKFLNKSSSDQTALNEIKNLKRLQGRLCSKLQNVEETPITPQKLDLNVKDKESFIKQFKNTKYYRTLMNIKRYDDKKMIESCINTLVNYINNDQKSFSFDNLKFNQKFMDAEEEDINNITYGHVEEIEFPDIVMFNESGVPVILLRPYNLMEKLLFKKGSKAPKRYRQQKRVTRHMSRAQQARSRRLAAAAQYAKMSHFSRFRKTVDCPLLLLNDPNLKNSVEYFYNLESFKGMVENNLEIGPHTGERFTGAIVPLEEFDDYNDYILACTYFDRRRVPFNKGLLYYVLYKTCEKLEYIEPSVVKYLKEYVIKRISKTTCYLGLSRISADDPLMRVNLTTALWYCAELSSIIFKDDPKHFKKEKLRMYSYYTDYMKEILEWFHYDVDNKLVDSRANMFRHVNSLKRIPRPADRVNSILEQVFKKEEDFLLAEIVNPENIHKLQYLLLDHKQVLDDSLLSAEVDLHKFAHFMDHVETTDVPVCKQTMRPYFVTQDKTTFYDQLKMKTKRVVIQKGNVVLEPVDRLDFTRILSTNNLYISYVQQHNEFPSLEQYKKYVLTKCKYLRGAPVVFATNTLTALEKTFGSYDKLCEDVNQFIQIAKCSVKRENRLKNESPTGHVNMDEISKYIQSSDTKLIADNEMKDHSEVTQVHSNQTNLSYVEHVLHLKRKQTINRKSKKPKKQ